LYGECRAGAQIIFPKSGCGLGHVTLTVFGSTVGYPSDSLASCLKPENMNRHIRAQKQMSQAIEPAYTRYTE